MSDSVEAIGSEYMKSWVIIQTYYAHVQTRIYVQAVWFVVGWVGVLN